MRVFFRINLSMVILYLIIVSLPVYFIYDRAKAILLRLSPFGVFSECEKSESVKEIWNISPRCILIKSEECGHFLLNEFLHVSPIHH